jgi:ligand-binding SRPBCC domain-containing protein
MFTISDSIHINAPLDRCFQLSTNIALLGRTIGMWPIDGMADGMLKDGDKLVWVGWKFGLPQIHESLISKYERPVFFQDTMGRGRFKRFQYDHSLAEIDGHTLLSDKMRFALPFGSLGKLVARKVMVPYLCRLLRERMLLLKQVAETEEWRRYLPEGDRD